MRWSTIVLRTQIPSDQERNIFQKRWHLVRFQILTAGIMKFRVLWDVAPCSLVEWTGV
jgi:hypothetical protein